MPSPYISREGMAMFIAEMNYGDNWLVGGRWWTTIGIHVEAEGMVGSVTLIDDHGKMMNMDIEKLFNHQVLTGHLKS